MTEYAISAFETAQFLFAGDKSRKPSMGRRVIEWIETNQQRRADREIARIVGRVRH